MCEPSRARSCRPCGRSRGSVRQRGAGRLVGAALLLAALVPAAASAGALPFDATLRFYFLPDASLDVFGIDPPTAYVVQGSGIADVHASGGHLTSVSIPAGVLQATHLGIFWNDSGSLYPIASFQFSFANGSGVLARTGGGHLGGALPLAGAAKLCLFSPCSAAPANLSVPLSPLGGGGTRSATNGLRATIAGNEWTTQGTLGLPVPGTLTPVLGTFPGFARGPASLPSSTARPGGQLQLVVPAMVSAGPAAGSPAPLGELRAVLTLTFVPEPGSLALLVAGLGGLAVLGRRARR
jgi:hypothetical protein